MTLNEAVDAYITMKRSLGAVFSADAQVLRSFAHALGDIPLDAVDPQATYDFCRGSGPPTRWWERKHQTMRGFFAFLVTRGHLSSSPLREPAPSIPRSFVPYIYSREELKRLFEATKILEDKHSPLEHSTFRILLLVLYGAGLRPSEGLRLRCCDVDFNERILAVWDTKFSSLVSYLSVKHWSWSSIPTTKHAKICQCQPGLNRPFLQLVRVTVLHSVNLKKCLSDSGNMVRYKVRKGLAGNRDSTTCATPLPCIE